MNTDLFSCPFDEETVGNIALLGTMNSFVRVERGPLIPTNGSTVERWNNSEHGKIPSDLIFIIRVLFSNVENTFHNRNKSCLKFTYDISITTKYQQVFLR